MRGMWFTARMSEFACRTKVMFKDIMFENIMFANIMFTNIKNVVYCT